MEDTLVDNTDSDIDERASAPVPLPLPAASGELRRESLHGLREIFVIAFASSLKGEWDSKVLVIPLHFPLLLLLHACYSLVAAVAVSFRILRNLLQQHSRQTEKIVLALRDRDIACTVLLLLLLQLQI